jgi:hypothetical protein
MRNQLMYANLTFTIVTILASLLPGVVYAEPIEFKRIELDTEFRSEGVAVADVDNDQLPDVIVGDYWYKNPDWSSHEIRTPRKPNRGGYTEAFAVYAKDFDGDKWIDVLVIPFHGKDAKWYQNPKNKSGHWTERVAFRGTGNETRLYPDLFSDGNPVFLMGVEGRMSWVEVAKDPTQPWVVHPVDKSNHGAGQYYHGLGVGDLNGDGRNDVLTPQGWWEHPETGRKHQGTWTFHQANLGGGCADMFVADLDADGRQDVICTSAHGRGIWWHQQTGDADKPTFKQHTLDDSIHETHSLNYIDVNGDGRKDLVTGWRFYAHGFSPEKANDPSELAWFEVVVKKGETPTLVKHSVDIRSGVGAQFVTSDYNGDRLMDIVVSNRKGVFVFEQIKNK